MSPARPNPVLPKVLVLLATRNGERYLQEQLDSILGQQDVDVRILALDDESSDGTLRMLVEAAERDARITVLPPMGASGGSAANFLRLLALAEPREDELVAFADQDDIWLPWKLSRHAALIAAGADGVSSDVTAFDADGKRSLVRKAFPQRKLDFVFESPGPGCTFLMDRRVFDVARTALAQPEKVDVDFHDSFVYAVARAAGLTWRIDDRPSVDYRQHGGNVFGANVGASSAISRLKLMGRRWHRDHAVRLVRAALPVATAQLRPQLESLLPLLLDTGFRARWALAARAGGFRRRLRDRLVVRTLILIGVW